MHLAYELQSGVEPIIRLTGSGQSPELSLMAGLSSANRAISIG